MGSITYLSPSFLVPRSIRIWRRLTYPTRRAYASSPSGGKIVLEKPAKFNPPSHGSRLPRGKGPRHYGGPLSETEIKAQVRRDYPGMPPPPGTFGHWFWRSPKVHAWVTIGTLGSLASYTLFERFKENSPYAFMLPSLYDWLRHPILSVETFTQMLLLNADNNTRTTLDARRSAIEDITKRKKYRRAHDIEDQTFLHKVVPGKYIKETEEALEESSSLLSKQ